MADINNVILIGRLVKDVDTMNAKEFVYTQNNQAVMNFSIAVNRSVNNNGTWQDETSFFNCTLFGRLAGIIKNYMKKGTQICVEGSLKQERWKDKQTNQNRERIVINAEKVQLLGSTQHQQNQQGFTQQPQPMNVQQSFQQNQQGFTQQPQPMNVQQSFQQNQWDVQEPPF